LYQQLLRPSAIILRKEKRSCGLLQEICDKIRNGQQSLEDLSKLMLMKRRFPDAQVDNGIHYNNERCSLFNWRDLWDWCKSHKKYMYVCKATYETRPGNQQFVEGLARLPPSVYNYAPDVLCVTEGCEVRLVKNINVSAGLVNGASGTVVKIIYNNADMFTKDNQGLLQGKLPSPYCIVIDMPSFNGFITKENPNVRTFPFPEHKTWVPIFREKFTPAPSSLPRWIKQAPHLCYRLQFPIDLCKHLTAHRAQGQTMSNAIVLIDLQLDNLDDKVPDDVGSILYVALTRVRRLADLLVSNIPDHVWKNLGKTKKDERRLNAEHLLEKSAEQFAISNGLYKEYRDEKAYKPDYSNNEAEWKAMIDQIDASPRKRSELAEPINTDNVQFEIRVQDGPPVRNPMHLKPVTSERNIGIDQGTHNFAIVVVDKIFGKQHEIMAADLIQDLHLRKKFTASDLVNALTNKSNLLNYMQIDGNPPLLKNNVDRVIVLLEYMDTRNSNSLSFTIGLGNLLQQLAPDVDKCIVKLSLAKNLRANGPAFMLGEDIVRSLHLTPVTYQRRRELPTDPQFINKKKMSADIFRYIVQATADKEAAMGLTMNADIRTRLMSHIASNGKLDDMGDALLHALNNMWCGGNGYRQMIPANPSVHNNRTVVVCALPNFTYYVVVNCTWNRISLEDFGLYRSKFESDVFKSRRTVEIMRLGMDDNLKLALTVPNGLDENGTAVYPPAEHIKMIVKQLQGMRMYNLTRPAAGKLQDALYKVFRGLAQSACNEKKRKLYECKSSKQGHVYVWTDTSTNNKFQVIKSAGKHLNAVQVAYEWAKTVATDTVNLRKWTFGQQQKLLFFEALVKTAANDEQSLEMLLLSERVRRKLALRHCEQQKQLYADLFLIAMNQNRNPVKAIAGNYRKP